MTSFDTLSILGTELSGEQLDVVDGGIVPVLIAMALGYAIGVGVGYALAQ